MTLQAIQNRIRELNTGHFIFGGSHNWFGCCPTCDTISKLKEMEDVLTQ